MASCLVTNISGNSARCSSDSLIHPYDKYGGGLTGSHSNIQTTVTCQDQSFNAKVNAEWWLKTSASPQLPPGSLCPGFPRSTPVKDVVSVFFATEATDINNKSVCCILK